MVLAQSGGGDARKGELQVTKAGNAPHMAEVFSSARNQPKLFLLRQHDSVGIGTNFSLVVQYPHNIFVYFAGYVHECKPGSARGLALFFELLVEITVAAPRAEDPTACTRGDCAVNVENDFEDVQEYLSR